MTKSLTELYEECGVKCEFCQHWLMFRPSLYSPDWNKGKCKRFDKTTFAKNGCKYFVGDQSYSIRKVE